jgi:hypothetical protein
MRDGTCAMTKAGWQFWRVIVTHCGNQDLDFSSLDRSDGFGKLENYFHNNGTLAIN